MRRLLRVFVVGGVGSAAALVLAAGSAGSPSGGALWKPPPLQNTWSGTWSTEWGDMTLTQSGGSIEGRYTHDQGHVAGTLNGGALTIKPLGGNVFTGRWDESPTRAGPNDAGTVILQMRAHGRSLMGRWNYEGSGTWHTSWSGTCKSGDCLLNASIMPIEAVSNGCGGTGWAAAEAFQNYLGNTSSYKNSNVNPLAKSYTVSFVAACNLHDAGYSGEIVADPIRGGYVDFRTWSRTRVDARFLADMRLLCDRQIPAAAKVARRNCRERGGNVSIGSVSRFDAVRKIGGAFFDADLTQTGTQKSGHRANN